MQECPACSFELAANQQGSAIEKCPACDIYFAKFFARQQAGESTVVASRARAKAAKRGGLLRTMALAAVLAGTGYVIASPYIVVNSIRDAADRRDSVALAEHIDFPVLRENVKQQFTATINESLAAELEGNPFASAGAALATTIVNAMIDTVMTPNGLMLIMNGEDPSEIINKQVPTQYEPSEAAAEPDVSMGYLDLNRFSIAIDNETGEQARLILHRHGLVDWKISDLDVQAGAL